MRALEQAMWGIKGENGLTQQLRGLRHDIDGWRKEESAKREAATRAVNIALLAFTATLITTVVTLVVALGAQ